MGYFFLSGQWDPKDPQTIQDTAIAHVYPPECVSPCY